MRYLLSSSEDCKLIDLDDKLIDTVKLPARYKGQEPRSVVYCGRKFVETDGEFYGPGELIEVPRQN